MQKLLDSVSPPACARGVGTRASAGSKAGCYRGAAPL